MGNEEDVLRTMYRGDGKAGLCWSHPCMSNIEYSVQSGVENRESSGLIMNRHNPAQLWRAYTVPGTRVQALHGFWGSFDESAPDAGNRSAIRVHDLR